MRRYIRSKVAGATYFLTLTLQDRSARTLSDHAPLLRETMQRVQVLKPVRVDAMVVLPDHLHALWTLPIDDADFGVRCGLLKHLFTKRLARLGLLDARAQAGRGIRGERSLWQRRFWEHMIRDDDDFARHVDYIHFNPVKHGLVHRTADWPHSSFHRYVRQGRLPMEWGIAGAPGGRFGE